MIKNFGFLKSTLSVLIVVLCMLGCSDSNNDTTSNQVNYSDVNVSGRVDVSSGSSTSSPSFKVFMQNQSTKKVYTTDVDSSGTFSMDIEYDDSQSDGDVFHMALLDKDSLSYLATGVESVATNATNANTGISIQEDVTDLVIDYDDSKSYAVASSATNMIDFDPDYVSRVDSDEILGVASNGKGASTVTASVSSINKLDPDQDGVPNIFDSMDDGARLDNTIGSTRQAAVAGSSVASYASMFMNYKIEYIASQSSTITDNAIITIEVKASDASAISSIVADSVNVNYQNSTFAQFPVGFTQIDTFPAQGTRWDTTGYSLYHAQNMDGEDIWTAFLFPKNNAFDVGDMIRLKATLTDGTVEYYYVSINFKFQDFQLSTDSTTWIHGGSGSKSDPFCILDTGGRVFSWSAPKDELGADLVDVNYQLEFFFYENASVESVVHEGIAHVQDVGIDTYNTSVTESFIDTYESASPSPNILQVDITSSYEHGDNTAVLIYMARPKWGSSLACPD